MCENNREGPIIQHVSTADRPRPTRSSSTRIRVAPTISTRVRQPRQTAAGLGAHAQWSLGQAATCESVRATFVEWDDGAFWAHRRVRADLSAGTRVNEHGAVLSPGQHRHGHRHRPVDRLRDQLRRPRRFSSGTRTVNVSLQQPALTSV